MISSLGNKGLRYSGAFIKLGEMWFCQYAVSA
jgi:hypothetical protein